MTLPAEGIHEQRSRRRRPERAGAARGRAVSLTPTPVTAALAGAFSGLTWPLLWPSFSGSAAADTVGLVVATVLLVALPAHACVLGFQRPRPQAPGRSTRRSWFASGRGSRRP